MGTISSSSLTKCLSRLERYVEGHQLKLSLLKGGRAEISANSLETNLHSHDVAFALPPQSQHHQPRVSFKLILLSSGEAKTTEVKTKIERLSMLNGGQKVAIMLLLDGSGRVDSLVHLQMR